MHNENEVKSGHAQGIIWDSRAKTPGKNQAHAVTVTIPRSKLTTGQIIVKFDAVTDEGVSNEALGIDNLHIEGFDTSTSKTEPVIFSVDRFDDGNPSGWMSQNQAGVTTPGRLANDHKYPHLGTFLGKMGRGQEVSFKNFPLEQYPKNLDTIVLTYDMLEVSNWSATNRFSPLHALTICYR